MVSVAPTIQRSLSLHFWFLLVLIFLISYKPILMTYPSRLSFSFSLIVLSLTLSRFVFQSVFWVISIWLCVFCFCSFIGVHTSDPDACIGWAIYLEISIFLFLFFKYSYIALKFSSKSSISLFVLFIFRFFENL